MKTASFKVDTRLAILLGENYRSSELALKELVDNAWDADAENIKITLPSDLTTDPIIIEDDGSGMIEKEVRDEYLFIANDRRTRKGEFSVSKKRIVKGRKGIGKFSGLSVASTMIVETYARGVKTKLIIERELLEKSKFDLEKIDLPIEVSDCEIDRKGTTITLLRLNQNLSYPHPERFSQLLFIDYGRENGVFITVNNKSIGIENLSGEVCEGKVTLPYLGEIKYRFIITDVKTKIRFSGLALRVDGKVIGRPHFFGLDNDEEIPTKLINRLFGEIQADGLKDEITADWGAVIENSIGFISLKNYMYPILRGALSEVFKKEISLVKARLKKQLNRKLEKLPEYRRLFAERALDKILKKFYWESEEKISALISLILDSFEKDEYWFVLEKIEKAKDSDIEIFADALNEFGLVDIAMIARQAQSRLKFLDFIDQLIIDKKRDELQIHKAIEKNLWILGTEYQTLSSNQGLKNTVEKYTTEKYSGQRGNKRPDLLLIRENKQTLLLIEFKATTETINRTHEAQALTYRDELLEYFHNFKIDVLVIGGKVEGNLKNEKEGIMLKSFTEIISDARYNLEWLLTEYK